MATVQSELQGWLSHITQYFGRNGETGIDIGLPYNTPIYAVTSGTVLGAGYYGGGGVVSIKTPINYGGINGPASIYYQHLSSIVASVGQYIQAGQLIGYSGGQLGYGNHPSSPQFSNGPHIEIGINAPYQGIWSPLGPNVNPLNFFQNIMGNPHSPVLNGAGNGGSTGGSTTQEVNSPIPGVDGIMNAINGVKNALTPLVNLTNTIGAFWNSVSDWITNPWRIVKLLVGVALLVGVSIALIENTDIGQQATGMASHVAALAAA